MIICLKQFGTHLRIRSVASGIRESISKNDTVIFDFSDVEFMTHSFCDELFGLLLFQYGEDFFRKNVVFKNFSEDLKPILRRTLLSRKEEKNGLNKLSDKKSQI